MLKKLGSRGTTFYIIIKGRVGVLVPEWDRKKPILHEVKELGVGESFGELALINDETRNASIKCKEECHFAILNKENYSMILGMISFSGIII